MQSLDKLNTPPSRITQAYLLIQYGKQSEIFQQQRRKCFHDATRLLKNLYQQTFWSKLEPTPEQGKNAATAMTVEDQEELNNSDQNTQGVVGKARSRPPSF